jgi:hypothetical protein
MCPKPAGKGANANYQITRLGEGSEPVFLAVSKNNLEIVKLLIKSGLGATRIYKQGQIKPHGK